MGGRTTMWKFHGLFLSSIPQTRHFHQDAIKTVIETQNFHQIPVLLSDVKPHINPNPNPFSFLSSSSFQTQIVDEILQSFLSIRPRSCLFSHTLQTPDSLPLALAVLRQTLRSSCDPAQQTHLTLSLSWRLRRRCQSVAGILSKAREIGYQPYRGTCNYLLSLLCSVGEGAVAVRVLKGMRRAGCDPDSESYGKVIKELCQVRRTEEAGELVREMVGEMGLMPRQGTVGRAVAANREAWRALEMVGFLEREGCEVGFENYEMVVEGCVDRGEYVLAGKVVMEMAQRAFVTTMQIFLFFIGT